MSNVWRTLSVALLSLLVSGSLSCTSLQPSEPARAPLPVPNPLAAEEFEALSATGLYVNFEAWTGQVLDLLAEQEGLYAEDPR